MKRMDKLLWKNASDNEVSDTDIRIGKNIIVVKH